MSTTTLAKVGTKNAGQVILLDSNGDQVTSFGGGTQYTEGDTDASMTGTVMMMEGAANTALPVQGTVADGLLVNLGANNDITGSVTANAGTNLNTSALALETTASSIKTAVETIDNAISGNEMQVDVLTMPTTTVQATNLDIRDLAAASDSVTVHGDVGVLDQLDLTNANPAAVAIVDGNGDQITSFGGGTQYTEGDTDASITGTAILMEGAANTLVPVQGTAADGLLVNLGGNNDVTVTGTVTAAQATAANLNMTEANSAAIKTAVEILDNAISGNEMQVDVLTMPTVQVQSNSANLATQTTAAAIQTSVELIDDAVATLGTTTYSEATTKGLIIGAVRRDADTTLANTTNEVTPLQVDANGYLKVEVFDGGGSHTVDNNGTFAVQVDGSALTALQLIDDTVTTLGTDTYTEATSKGITMGAVRRDADTTLVNTTNEFGPLQMDANGRLKVEAFSGEALPITDNSGSLTVDQPTASNLNMTEASAASILTAVQLIDDAIFVDDTATHSTGSTKGVGIMAAATPTDTSISANDIGMVAMTTDRQLHVRATVASGGIASGAIASGAIASGAIASGALATGAIAAGDASIATTEDTARAAGEHLVKVGASRLDTPVANANCADNDYTNLLVDNYGKLWTAGTALEDVAHVAGEAIKANGARRLDTAATSAGSSGDWATVDASAEGALWTVLTPTTTSGCSIFRSLDLDETEEEIKATAGNVYGYFVFNAAATTHYLKFYNATAANVTVGSTTPVLTFPVPAGAAANISFAYPISFGTAISVAVTTGVADADTGAPAANAFIANIFYK